MEGLKDFVERLSKDVGFYYHLCERTPQYSLKRYNTNKPKQMGVFGWVRELKRRGQFEITIYKITGDALKITDADEIKEGYIYLSKDDDPEGKSKALIFYVDRESSGKDYQKSVKALKAIMDKMIAC